MAAHDGHLRIGNRRIGKDEPCYIIAEGGVNHNGDLSVAKRLADAARDAGADAIKFQKRKLSEVYQQHVLDEPRRGEQGLQYLVPLLAEFSSRTSSSENWRCTAAVKASSSSARRGTGPASTFWRRSTCWRTRSGSPDMTNFPLIQYVARTGKPFLISTGMSTEDEIRLTLAFIENLQAECGVFHCVSTYPVSADEVNLRFMLRLRERCPRPIGYSGHEDGIAISTAAVGMGATMLERHITLDRSMRGPDHAASLEPHRFKDLVTAVREVEAALARVTMKSRVEEGLNRPRTQKKSLVAATDIAAGTTIAADMVTTKSPGMGLSPQQIGLLIGRELPRALRRDEMFLETDLCEEVTPDSFKEVNLGMPWGVVARAPDLEALFARFGPQGMAFVEIHLSDRDLNMRSRQYYSPPAIRLDSSSTHPSIVTIR